MKTGEAARRVWLPLLCAALLALFLNGCTSGDEAAAADADPPGESLLDAAARVRGLDPDGIGGNARLFALHTRCEFGEVIDGRAEVVVTAPDLEALLLDVVEHALSGTYDSYDDMYAGALDYMAALLEDRAYATVRTAVTMDAVEADGGWLLLPNGDWERAVSGGIDGLYLDAWMALMEGGDPDV